MEKIKRLSFLHIFLIAMLVLALYYALILQYDDSFYIAQQNINLTRETIEQKKKEVENLKSLIQSFSELQNEYNATAETLSVFSKYISEIENATTFFSQTVNSPAVRTMGIYVNSYESGEEKFLEDDFNNVISNNYKIISLTISIKGTFSQLLLFISHLSQIKQLITIESLKISKMEEDQADGQLSLLSLTGKIILYSLTSTEDKLQLQQNENDKATGATSSVQPVTVSSSWVN